jgi:hypothetical protein
LQPRACAAALRRLAHGPAHIALSTKAGADTPERRAACVVLGTPHRACKLTQARSIPEHRSQTGIAAPSCRM